jgi:phosphoglycerate dehydrogenase-like enzyme
MKIKERVILQIVSFKKPRWKPDKRLKVLIAVNNYFTEKEWGISLIKYSPKDAGNWDIVYCKNRLDIYRHVPNADVCFIFGLGTTLLKQLKSPKMIYLPLLGLDFLKPNTLPLNITFEQPPPYSAQSIAEYCMAMSIIITRNIHKAFTNRFEKKWSQNNILPKSHFSILNCKIGVLGLGRVGKVIVGNFRNLGCDVIGCDKETPKDNILQIDILIIALPLNESTKKIIGVKELQELGKDKFLINVSRGEIIDEPALIQALSNDTIKGVVLDVFANEPLSSRSALYQCQNAIITPHIAGNINLFVNEIQKDFISKTIAYNRKTTLD